MNQQKLKVLFENIPEAILIVDSFGKIIFSNDTVSKLLGYETTSLSNRTFFILLDCELNSQILAFVAFKDAFENTTFKDQVYLLDTNGRRILTSLSITRIAYQNSDIFMVVANKVSEDTKTTNPALEEKDNMDQLDVNKTLLSQKPAELLILLDASLNIKYINNNSFHFLKLSPQQIIGTNLQYYVHPDDHQKIKSKITLVSRGMVNLYLSLQLLIASGEERAVEGYMDTYYDERGQLIYGLIRVKDKMLTVREEDDEALLKLVTDNSVLLKRKQFLETIYNYLPDAVLILNARDHQLIDFNQQAIRMFDASSQSDLSQNFLISHLASDAWQFLTQPKVSNSAVSEINYRTLSNKEFVGKTYLIDLAYNETDIRVIQISDITQQKNLEAKLRMDKSLAEQNVKSQEEFLSTMSHEIRTPLNAVLGMTHLMLQSKPREDQKKFLQTLKFAGENLTNLINDILDHSKMEAGQLQLHLSDFNLKRFIQGIKLTYKNLANEKGLAFRLLLEEDLPNYVHGDANRLGQILNNLLNNAIKFTKEGQVVMSVYIDQETADQYILLFEVQDSGIGIPKDRQEAIFNPYQQASSRTASQYGGTGLGLSIVKSLTELQQGKLSLQSEEGKGSTFKVEIPFGKAKEMTHEPASDEEFIQEYQPLEGLKVLYVEDVIPNQLLMEGLCDNWKIDLDTALNGLEALEKVKNNHYDLILMDILMPEKNGYDTATEIRKLKDPHYENIPIIALSASVSDTTQQRIYEAGMNDYLPKPIDPRNLHEKLSKFSRSFNSPQLVSKEVEENIAYEPEPHSALPELRTVDQPDFSQLRAIYHNDTSGYLKIIEQIRKLTIDSSLPLTEALKARDEASFRYLCHKIMSYVKLVNLQKLEEVIEESKAFLRDTSTFSESYLISNLNFYLQGFIQETEKELNQYR